MESIFPSGSLVKLHFIWRHALVIILHSIWINIGHGINRANNWIIAFQQLLKCHCKLQDIEMVDYIACNRKANKISKFKTSINSMAKWGFFKCD